MMLACLGCILAASRLHLGCISAASRLHLDCISAASRLHLRGMSVCILSVGSALVFKISRSALAQESIAAMTGAWYTGM
jgi:hypothetical protein